MGQTQLQLSYFGKLPSRGDFVKSANSVQLPDMLDRWLVQGMELPAEAPNWKSTYDSWKPVQSVFLGSQSKPAIADTLMASSDLSSRRFPFLTAAATEVERPINFITHNLTALVRLWTRAGQQMLSLGIATGATEGLRLPTEGQHDMEAGTGGTSTQLHDASFSDSIDLQAVAGLEQMLYSGDHNIRLRRTPPMFGTLPQPVMANDPSRFEKGLTLPLPADLLYRSPAASSWLELVSRPLQWADFELLLFLDDINGVERLVIGFNGASSHTSYSTMSPLVYAEQNINIDDPGWVDQHASGDYDLVKFVSYLDQSQLLLCAAVDTFREVFIGG